MLLGMKTKVRKGTSVQLTYLICIQEIKPWPPSQSLRSLRSVQIQWEHGEKRTGSTNAVIPSLGSGANDGKIEFNESFRLPVTLMRNMSVKAGDADLFQKNCLEFSMYEPRRDKTLKGQLLGTATVDLAEYGVIRQNITISVPVKCQRNYKNTAEPLLYFEIQPFGKSCNKISSTALSKEASLNRISGESVSALMKEEYAEEAESNTYSDDDVSSNSSMAISSDSSGGLPPKREQESSSVSDKGKGNKMKSFGSDMGLKECDATSITASREDIVVNSSRSSSMDLTTYDLESPDNGQASSISPRSCSISFHKAVVRSDHSSLSSFTSNQRDEDTNGSVCSEQNLSSVNCANTVNTGMDGRVTAIDDDSLDVIGKSSNGENRPENNEVTQHQYVGSGATDPVSRVVIESQCSQGIDMSSIREDLGASEFTPSERLRHVRSVRSTSDFVKSNGTIINPLTDEIKGSCLVGDSKNGPNLIRSNERKDAKASARDARTTLLEAKAQQMEIKIQMLEGELREVAAVEVALYSIVAEHGSSISKVHAPARRLSRFYLHAGQAYSLSRRASAARSAISGLILVSKACGNDVPRLTYWLSNSVVLRAIISKAMADNELSTSAAAHTVDTMKQNDKTPALKWESSPIKNKNEFNRTSDWEDPQTFISALEKVEAWIFSRAVESIWWQTLTPPMQWDGKSSDNTKATHAHDQLNLWKKAFTEACERLCPVRAGGHECGCLSMLPRLIMEQCVSRLDVALFNAILRESDDDTPTDPVSDPISDTKVLPIPPGKSSFGDGAQLKNVIGNWSRWLTDLFGMDGDSDEAKNESHNGNDDDDDDDRQDSSFKSFHLLNALSDLMMLPKDMLLSKTIRQEVCPTFSVSLIKRVLNTFVPDEFCPDPIPGVVFEALDSEDQLEDGSTALAGYPYNAAPPLYTPPSPTAVATIIGECGTHNKLQRVGSSLLRKSYTSDDELDELNSPLALIFTDESRSRDNGVTQQTLLRFDLLRNIWLNSE